MFARRAVSTVARRAVVARPIVPARSFASSVRRCEFCWFFAEGIGGAIGGDGDGEMNERGLRGIPGEALV